MTATEANSLKSPSTNFTVFFFFLQYNELLLGRRVYASSRNIWPESAANSQTFGGGVSELARQTPAGDSSFLPVWGVWAGVRGPFPLPLH